MYHPNDPQIKSWLTIPEGSDFPIQNLPFGIFRTDTKKARAGVAIGEYILDLHMLQKGGFLEELKLPDKIFRQPSLNAFFALGRKKVGKVRKEISKFLNEACDKGTIKFIRKRALVPMEEAELLMPIEVGDYTDFYSSEDHARNVGTMFRDPENALLPNWKHLPVGYHGRASSIVVSGTPLHRPLGQTKAPDAEAPSFGPSKRLDFELEVAFITCRETRLGERISTGEAEDHIIGLVLFNDWSARDIQVWEYVPLGPFLAKNFGSSISPWVVTLDALEPFKVEGPTQDPEPLDYLKYEGKHHYDINLEVALSTDTLEETTICRSNYKYMYWNMAQQLAHQTVNGCNIRVGDLYASGTISGPKKDSYGSMLELSWKGTKPLKLSDGSTRTFIEDGDVVTMRGFAEKGGVRIGFGEVVTRILPARE
ncbi:fumarylacetoacetase [Cesiribacter andamanensis]|uniref:fumarylacetoacetase n=1 Tax=Cesiribacter andamanensis AMV16 TaxID=1279009 RepID=M7N4C9_9BACT|nr:fumarylacetoacetase [Cesiribacter andamanensis]EMR03528.1 2-keto-4-pentenoate hydratase/2-oxohepta-3-ene-1,7-dioic acid hydratase (catechol pathway) [Cesiribacter andamanensis AMV16]